MLFTLMSLRRILATTLFLTGGLIETVCSFMQPQPPRMQGFDLFAERPSEDVHVAEGGSAVANSLLIGSASAVPGSVSGTAKEVVAAPATGPGARVQMLVVNGGATSTFALNPNGSVAGRWSAPSGFGNISSSIDGSLLAGSAGTVFTLYNTASGATVPIELNTATIVPPPATGNVRKGQSTFSPRISPAPSPAGTVMMPDKSGAYVTDRAAASFYWVNFADQSVKAYANAVSPAGSGRPAILPNGSQLWIPNPAANSITVYDTFTNTPVTTITGVASPTEIAFTGDGTRAAVISRPQSAPGSIVDIDTTQYTVLGSAQVGFSPAGLSADPYNSTFWVANSGSGTIMAVDVSGAKPVVVETHAVGTTPVGVAVLNTFVK